MDAVEASAAQSVRKVLREGEAACGCEVSVELGAGVGTEGAS